MNSPTRSCQQEKVKSPTRVGEFTEAPGNCGQVCGSAEASRPRGPTLNEIYRAIIILAVNRITWLNLNMCGRDKKLKAKPPSPNSDFMFLVFLPPPDTITGFRMRILDLKTIRAFIPVHNEQKTIRHPHGVRVTFENIEAGRNTIRSYQPMDPFHFWTVLFFCCFNPSYVLMFFLLF